MTRKILLPKIDDDDKKRLTSIQLFLFFIFFLLLIQFYKIQVIEGDMWKKKAEAQHQHTQLEPYIRGSFFSNPYVRTTHLDQPQPFVIDVPKFHLNIDPESIPPQYKSDMANKIVELAKAGHAEKQKIIKAFYLKSRCRKILCWLDSETKERIQKWWFDYASKKKMPRNALFFSNDYRRSYPYGSLLGQLLHTVQNEKEPTSMQCYPTGGLEMYFNHYLKGKAGRRIIMRSPRHPLDVGKVVEEPEHGADIYLTVNNYLQAIAEEELEKGVKKANAKGGWAIMMEPSSGEIYAIAQYPFFDVSSYQKYFNNKNLEEHTKLRAVVDAFEPGSIFKPITLSLCLQANENRKKEGKMPFFAPLEKVATSNGYFAGRATPLKDTHTHRYLNMYMGIQKSSNIYLGKIVQRVKDKLGDEWLRNSYATIYNLGDKTGIEYPAETSGLLPRMGKLHPNGKPEWSMGTAYSLVIGHSIMVNSVQVVRCYGILANGGYEVKPTLIRKIVKKDNDNEVILLDNTKREKEKRRVLDKKVVEEVVKAMKYTTKRGGTAFAADIPGYTKAGKTGTSEKIVNGKYSENKYISSFIGFTPVKNPRFVLMVVIDEPEVRYVAGMGKNYHGGVCAAPIFKEIAMRSLQYLGVPFDDPYSGPSGRDMEKADWMKEVKSLGELYRQWNEN
jgi:cell division protein FtsI (penicillin-binding protein 3)